MAVTHEDYLEQVSFMLGTEWIHLFSMITGLVYVLGISSNQAYYNRKVRLKISTPLNSLQSTSIINNQH